MKARHTKRPWQVHGKESLQRVVDGKEFAGIRFNMITVRFVADEKLFLIGTGTDAVPLSELLANLELMEAAPELLELLEWITRCAKMEGPHGGWMYAIKDDVMERARDLVARISHDPS